MRDAIVDILEKHLDDIEGVNYVQWSDSELIESQLPTVILRDTEHTIDNESTYKLTVEVDILMKQKASSFVAAQARALMQIVSYKIRDAVEEMVFVGRLVHNELYVDKNNNEFMASRLTFQVQYSNNKWSV